MSNYVAIPGSDLNEAGAIVWWTLSGSVDLIDIVEVLDSVGLPETWAPTAPRIETVAQRAATAAATSRRQLVRPLSKRSAWEFVTETVVGEGEASRLKYTANVRISVGEDGLRLQPVTPEDTDLAAQIGANMEIHRGLLNCTDMSNWLTGLLANHLQSVGLRDRGGFYFVPAGESLDNWRKICEVVRSVSGHKMYSMPAMTSDDAIEAILGALQQEADQAMEKLETYLQNENLSTRALNVWDRSMTALQSKVATYANLLGLNLESMTQRAETLLGGVTAARMIRDTKRK